MTELCPKQILFGHNFHEGADSIFQKLYPYPGIPNEHSPNPKIQISQWVPFFNLSQHPGDQCIPAEKGVFHIKEANHS